LCSKFPDYLRSQNERRTAAARERKTKKEVLDEILAAAYQGVEQPEKYYVAEMRDGELLVDGQPRPDIFRRKNPDKPDGWYWENAGGGWGGPLSSCEAACDHVRSITDRAIIIGLGPTPAVSGASQIEPRGAVK
jgi:hypothetical protein